jgi:putative membrane protein
MLATGGGGTPSNSTRSKTKQNTLLVSASAECEWVRKEYFVKIVNQFAIAVLASGLMLVPAMAQDPGPQGGAPTSGQTTANSSNSGSSGASKIGKMDSKFITMAAQGGLAEVQMGQLAQQKASDPAVKQLGQRLVQDHTKANDQLKSIAQQQGVTLPTEPSAADQQALKKFEGLSGSQFDQQFVAHAIKDHQKDIALFQKESQNGKDDSVKQFAQQTLPTLQEHLQMAQQANKSGATSASNQSNPK